MGFAVVGLIVTALAGWLYYHNRTIEYDTAWMKTIPPEMLEAHKAILNREQNGDFDGAVKIAVESLRNTPSDDILYNSISYSYFGRAQTNQASHVESVRLAVEYSEKAFATNPSDVVNLYNVAEAYKIAGTNLDDVAACDYFKRSIETFHRLSNDDALRQKSPVIENEQVDGSIYRKKLADKIEDVEQLMRTHCATSHERQR